ncbi:hypothetical protein [Micromonospora endophytica]|uniref:hypothetical protein n=1 Tax=Micromonospora endophytica TaxID=515350 RepID=UPI001CB90B93|nr:hypothetical protein [Micromonospora endophytica]
MTDRTGTSAAGVLYALHVSGAGRWPEHEQWLVRRATSPGSGTRCGFYDGLHGVGYALELLDRRQDALDVLDAAWRAAERVVEQLADDPGPDVSGGRHPYAGLLRGRTRPALMLVRLHELTGEPELLAHAVTALRQDLRRCVVRPALAPRPPTGHRPAPDSTGGPWPAPPCQVPPR